MTALMNLFSGENIRKTLEGVSQKQILDIMAKSSVHYGTSPFAKVIGVHLYSAPPSDSKASTGNSGPDVVQALHNIVDTVKYGGGTH